MTPQLSHEQRTRIIAQNAKAPQLTLPPEVWLIVLDCFQHLEDADDLIWLWLGGRHVCTQFRHKIDTLFASTHLPVTTLRCELGTNLRCWNIFASYRYQSGAYGSSSVLGSHPAHFVLDKVTSDRASFKIRGHHDWGNKTVFRRLHEKLLIGTPPVSIQTRWVVNDTSLPDLRIDNDDDTISFNWKGMFTQLLGEEHVYNTISKQGLGWHLDPENASASIHETHRRIARRSRLQRECRARCRSNIFDHYVHAEHESMLRLYYLRYCAYVDRTGAGEEEMEARVGPNVYLKGDWCSRFEDVEAQRWPGSVPRGIFTDDDHCSPAKSTMPKPSTQDIFSQRVPDLSRGWPIFDHPTPPPGTLDSKLASRIGKLRSPGNAAIPDSRLNERSGSRPGVTKRRQFLRFGSVESQADNDQRAVSQISPDVPTLETTDELPQPPKSSLKASTPSARHAKNSSAPSTNPRMGQHPKKGTNDWSGLSNAELESQSNVEHKSIPGQWPTSNEVSALPITRSASSQNTGKRAKDDGEETPPKKRVRIDDCAENTAHIIKQQESSVQQFDNFVVSRVLSAEQDFSSPPPPGASSSRHPGLVAFQSPRRQSMHEARKIRYSQSSSLVPNIDPMYVQDACDSTQQTDALKYDSDLSDVSDSVSQGNEVEEGGGM